MEALELSRRQVLRQLMHWQLAVQGLANLDQAASPAAWATLEGYLGVSLRANLTQALVQLQRELEVILAKFRAARDVVDLNQVSHEIIRFRRRYLQTETLIDFYGDAVNSRTSRDLGSTLRAFDQLAVASMQALLPRLGAPVPPVLTYLDKGLGASILKAGLRLWDGGTVSAVAAIKVTYHNRRRPTSLLHEVGHQVAHILHWNEELAEIMSRGLVGEGPELAQIWASWASEIAADCYAFVHCGYAAVAALADVVGGSPAEVFQYFPGDPHPIAYLRVLFGVECCRRMFGRGPWDDLLEIWQVRYDPAQAPSSVRGLLNASRVSMPRIVDLSLLAPARAFANRPLTAWIDPERVNPRSLRVLESEAGAKLYSSPHWVKKESVRIVALTGLRLTTEPERFREIINQHDQAMATLGTGDGQWHLEQRLIA